MERVVNQLSRVCPGESNGLEIIDLLRLGFEI